ncbi:site-specific DNA-methyltransferase [Priestia megaterium]|uniref:site-specific DNA-methyltransferase n=1 Tax=Priestia megaterium TaxID=1404 RepID=UPI002ACE448F|nr:DNA methyltransferase [Priestia megaterium]
MATEAQTKLIRQLTDMFQFDQADLDFGIYRIMNQKRDEIKNFLENELPNEISQELVRVSSDKMSFSEVESAIYSHLLEFFSRYYDEGDFISQRRYKDGVYAIPYEGEEVKLYWANSDQYYVKSSENFQSYKFKTVYGDVQFVMLNAQHENDNNKNDKKEFRLADLDSNPEIKDGVLTLYFEYVNVKRVQQKKQNEETIQIIANRLQGKEEFHKYFGILNTVSKNDSTLSKELNRYTAKNTFDYFIHKNLKSFLKRELDFYIKNEVVFLDNFSGNEVDAHYVTKAKIIEHIGAKIITFLAQLEDFQKKLWLKKKFVVATEWCITLDKIPEEYYAEIANNDSQIKEWIKLFAIDDIGDGLTNVGYSNPLSVDFLMQNKYLLVDTKFFSQEFKEKVLSRINRLDEETNGVMIHSDNFQAINLLKKQYANKIDCIYIDPPYNTDATPILYKNGYKESSWLSMMHDRLLSSRQLLDSQNGYYSVAIDDAELHQLYQIMEQALTNLDLMQVIVNHYPGSGTGRSNVSKTHEYNIFAIPKGKDILRGNAKEAAERVRGFSRSGTGDNNYRYGRPNSFYAVLVDSDTHEIKGFEEPPALDEEYPTENTEEGYLRIYPIGGDGSERCWTLGYVSAQKYLDAGLLRVTKNNVIQRVYHDEASRELLPSLWVDKKYSAVSHGTNLLTKMFNQSGLFSFPKSLYTVKTAIEAGMFDNQDGIVLDFFAGSGTTGHAVMDLNRDDFGNRKFILADMGEYFLDLTKSRILKASYCNDWKNGKPLNREDGQSRLIKYIKLESYEDALNNIEFSNQVNAMDLFSDDFLSEYQMKYMLDVESQGSDTLLALNKMDNPFNYTMKIHESNEVMSLKIDLIETFNYLVGLSVISYGKKLLFDAVLSKTENGKITAEVEYGNEIPFQFITGTLPNGKKSLIIWRKLSENLIEDNAILESVIKKIEVDLTQFSYVYINGDSYLQESNSHKVLQIEQIIKKEMFETEVL